MKSIKLSLIILVSLTILSCEKEFLEKKPDKALVIPSTLKDLRALLDHEEVMNKAPALGVLGGDEYYFTPDRWTALTTIERNGYVWNKEVYEGGSVMDWNACYEQVFYANVVLEGIERIPMTSANEAEHKDVKGSALFFRAHAFFQLAQLFAAPYQNAALTKPGIPLRLSPDINQVSRRATVKETYDRILSDLMNAKALVPAVVPVKARVSRAAVFALLARTHLAMQKYPEALSNADSALAFNSSLLDYNTLSTNASRPVPANNTEVIFNNLMVSRSFLRTAIRDTLLFNSYHSNDLRRTIFFNTGGNFRGTYSGNLNFFSGLATDELYLTKAECQARAGRTQDAVNVINELLNKRFKKGTFVPLTAANDDEALALILQERKKQLFFRGLRWMDLRRLNQDTRFAMSLTRNLKDEVFTLPPNDLRYVYPIPDEEIRGSGIEQNPR